MSEVGYKKLIDLTNDIADIFIEIIKAYNENNIIKVCYLFENDLNFLFCQFKKELVVILNYYLGTLKQYGKTMQKILIYGLDNDIAYNLDYLIDPQKVEIIAFLEANCNLEGKSYNGIPIYGINYAKNIDFDYIIVTRNDVHSENDFFENMLNSGRVLNISRFVDLYYNFELYRSLSNFKQNYKNIMGVITGCSYVEMGIDISSINYEFVNLALSSQDLFFDYNFIKYALSFNEVKKSLKYCIIGLSYYSFQYDLSKSIFKTKAYYYYPIFETMHNNTNEEIINQYENFKKNSELIFSDEFIFKIHEILQFKYEVGWDKYTSGVMENTKNITGKELAERDSDKNYPHTVNENIEILRSYLQLLKEYNIKPIITIAPASKYYTDNFSERIENEFKSIIKSFNKEYDFQYIDKFRSDEFTDEDFYHVSHLNKKGAEKFTKILNEIIEW